MQSPSTPQDFDPAPNAFRASRALLTALLAALLVACGERQPVPKTASNAPGASGPVPQALTQPAAPPAPSERNAGERRLPDFTALVARQGPAVVNVITTRRLQEGASRQNDPLAEFFRRFAPDAPDPEVPRDGLGSGFIISQDGYILTNAHVVADPENVTVRLTAAKREFKAKVIGADARTDVALLKVEAEGLPTAALGRSAELQVGEWVAAIGSPFGFDNTITAGIVSAKGRSLPAESFVPFIQTDVAVNPGNSGGPLLNLKGEVVGMNSMIYSRTGGYMGVSFAIPIEVALEVSEQLRTHGKVTRGRIGVQIQPLNRDLAQSFKLEEPEGVLIASVEPGSPGEKAGLQPGDVILRYNGQPIDEAAELPRLVAAAKPGSRAALDIWRNSARRQVNLEIGEFPAEPRAAATRSPLPAEQAFNKLGLVVSELPPAQRRQLGLAYGLVVEKAEGAAARTGVAPGDVILAVNQVRFRSLQEFNRLLAEQKAGSPVALLVRRGDQTIYVAVAAAAAKAG